MIAFFRDIKCNIYEARLQIEWLEREINLNFPLQNSLQQ
jgi:hypothetical protein